MGKEGKRREKGGKESSSPSFSSTKKSCLLFFKILRFQNLTEHSRFLFRVLFLFFHPRKKISPRFLAVSLLPLLRSFLRCVVSL